MSDQQATSCWAMWRDYALYAPIGLATMVVEDLPQVAETTKVRVTNRLTVARIVGQYAVRTAGAYLTSRLDELAAERLAEDAAAAAGDAHGLEDDDVERTTPDETAADAAVAMSESTAADAEPSIVESTPEGVGGTPLQVDDPAVTDVAQLALADYDSLAASQIVARLEALPGDELEAIRVYESTHRQRRTVIGKVQQLQSADG